MASFVYNPSSKVSEILSKFLEFDPKSLQMGIWSGDLSLANVHLKKEAIKPYLNPKKQGRMMSSENEDPTLRDPLRIQLVKGSIGHLRVKIPWKQMVWGQGAVQVEVSDVTIVLSLQSREQTSREEAMEAAEQSHFESQHAQALDDEEGNSVKSETNPKRKEKKKDGRSKLYHKAYREVKQRRLREAEKRLSNNGDIAKWLEHLHQKRSISKEAHRVEQKELGLNSEYTNKGRKHSVRSSRHQALSTPPASATETIKEGKFDRFLKSLSSDLFWRLFAGVKGSITKARVVLLQDGIEVGCIVQSIQVLAGKDGIESFEIQSHHGKNQGFVSSHNSSTNNSGGTDPSAMQQPQYHDHYESAYDDGEHVDKLLRQNGLGIFVRQETNYKQLRRIPNELRFSSSVEADDYILRPVAKLDIGFSFFFPYPPERRKKVSQAPSSRTTDSTATTVNISATSKTRDSHENNYLGSTASVGSQKSGKRRGKRDKQPPPSSPESAPLPYRMSKDDSHLLSSTISRTRLETIASASAGILSPGSATDLLITPASRRSSSGDSFFSDPRIPLEESPADAVTPIAGRPQIPPLLPMPTGMERSFSTNDDDFDRRGKLRKTRSADDSFGRLFQTTLFPTNTTSDRRHRAQRLRTPLRGANVGFVPQPELSRGAFASKEVSLSNRSGNNNSTTLETNLNPPELYSTALVPDKPSHPCPRLQLRVGVDEVQVVFTTRHYELLNYLCSTITRMKNGRPDRTIRSVSETEPGQELKELLRKLKKNPKELERISSSGSEGKRHEGAAGEGMQGPLPSYHWWSSTPAKVDANQEEAMQNDVQQIHSPTSGSIAENSYPSGIAHPNTSYNERQWKSARQEVVAQWWKYAVGAIQWEIRKRKHMTSVFHDMYISFDWKKQRHRRQEYIDLYLAYKLNNKGTQSVGSRISAASTLSSSSMMGWSSGLQAHKQKQVEEKICEIEDELSMEQILLYRSIARGMRFKGIAAKMPSTVFELWGEEGVTSAEMTRKRSKRTSSATTTSTTPKRAKTLPNRGVSFGSTMNPNNTSFESQDVTEYGEQNSTLLGVVQEKFHLTQRLREKGGVQAHFDAHDGSTDTVAVVDPTRGDSSTDVPSMALDDLTTKKNSRGIQAGQFYRWESSKKEFGTIGADLQSRVEGKSLRSIRSKRLNGGTTIGTSVDTNRIKPEVDTRMRLFFSFHVKKFNVIVVEEECLFDFTPELHGIDQYRDADGSEREHSSSLDLSDLSVLTDDQRFFGEDGNDDDVIIEEEEDFQDSGMFKMRSTDFLAFGQPENPLLRLTITSFLATSKGISGGGMEVGVSIVRIEATGDKDTHILSIGPSEPSLPLEVVDLDGSIGRSNGNRPGHSEGTDLRSIDLSTCVSENHHVKSESMVFTRRPSRTPRQALSLKFSKQGPSKIIQSDISKIKISANVDFVDRLLVFYSKPEVKQPENLLPMTSRDVARKIMVKKISNAPTKSLSAITSAIRVHGFEIEVPFDIDEAYTTEDSDVDSSYLYSRGSNDAPLKAKSKTCATVLKLANLELYSGGAVDELVQTAAIVSDSRDQSVTGGSLSSLRTQTVNRALEMLHISELTSIHDSFVSRHFVITMRGISCGFESSDTCVPNLMEIPVNVELLVTNNDVSILDTNDPRQQIVAEVSPVHLVLSDERLALLSATASSLNRKKFHSSASMKKSYNPDPPRIEILSRRILNSLDVTCSRLRIELAKDIQVGEALLPPKMKELVMEEALSDFLSIVACFELGLPNEEALSSAMQVCIGRLVGLGLSDDEAWACTNRARENFLDGIAMVRSAQTELFTEVSKSIAEKAVEEDTSASSDSFGTEEDVLNNDESVKNGSTTSNSSEELFDSGEFSDDDSKNSARMVETTIGNAVEKTVSAFSVLLQAFSGADFDMDDSTFLFIDLPAGLSFSTINLVYDQHIQALAPSLVVTNKAGIEVLTLVPNVQIGSIGSLEDDEHSFIRHGLYFSRFCVDDQSDFGAGGLPMTVLASDEGAEFDLPYRRRAKFDDIEFGELEFFFSECLFEEIVDELRLMLPDRYDASSDDTSETVDEKESLDVHASNAKISTVVMASSVSFLFTSDALVPFCRITLESACVKNEIAMESLGIPEMPTFALVARVFSIHNLSPEGQFFPEILASSTSGIATEYPFQIRYFQSSDAWRQSNRLEIDFHSYRLLLVRQFINDFLQYFVYDKYGVGKLRKKYETEVSDVHGNGKPPLLYSVYFCDSSIICPRNSVNADMIALEVDDITVSVSYVPKTFSMPTKSSPFCASPKTHESTTTEAATFVNDSMSRSSHVSFSDYEDCESSLSDHGAEPVSSHSNDLIRRLTICLGNIQAFTAIASDEATRDIINSPLFRFMHSIDGRAEQSKPVYLKAPKNDTYSKMDDILEFETCIQAWEEITTNPFSLDIIYDSAPHMRLFVSCKDSSKPLSLDARLSQLTLLLSVWDSNMQELGTMCPLSTDEVFESAKPPNVPEDFPEYASEDFVTYLENIKSVRSEICCMFGKISFRCTFDEPGYFSKNPDCFQYFDDPACVSDVKPGIVLTFEDMVVHVVNNHLDVKRIAIGSSSVELLDERRVSSFQSVLSTERGSEATERVVSWADLSWGLRQDVKTFDSSLPQHFQASVFMTPGWSMTNLGIQDANGAMADLSWIWVLLGYFKSYYSDGAFGNQAFEAQQWTHRLKNAIRRSSNEGTLKVETQPGLNIDFRVWLCQPTLCLPSDYFNTQAPCLVLSSETGIWYRYKSIKNFSSQEVVSTALDLSFANEFIPPERYRYDARSRATMASSGSIRPIIEGLSFGLRYDINYEANHKDVSFAVPFPVENAPSLAITGKELEIEPISLRPPTVLKPPRPRTRRIGAKVCNVTCAIDLFPLASATIMNFLSGPMEVNTEFSPKENESQAMTISVAAKVGDMRMFLIDPDLGVQLPIAVLSLSSASFTMSKFASGPITRGLDYGESQPSDTQIILSSEFWIDYFKLGLTRSWEPFLEPFAFEFLYEVSTERGQGYSFTSDCPLHFNLSGALLSVLSETIESFGTIIDDTFGVKDDRKRKNTKKSESTMMASEDTGGARLQDVINTSKGRLVSVVHEFPKSLKGDDKIAFSMRNLSGQRIRIHQQSNLSNDDAGEAPVVVTYLNQGESVGLTFDATISVVKNLGIVEVPYPGFEVSEKNEGEKQGSLNHAIDIQIPGCRWLQSVRLDSFGRKFQSLTPRSPEVFDKISKDWRLQNALSILTEVGPDNGGRLLSVRSIFQIRNNTNHTVNLVFHPDPRYMPLSQREESANSNIEKQSRISSLSQSEIFTIKPSCDFQVPTLLLESALEMEGRHLGSVWVRPDTTNAEFFSFRDFSKPTESKIENFDASFCSRPVQLAKIVHESSLIYSNGGGEDIGSRDAKTGVQLSCPTHSRSGNIRTPFCYAIEISRSPIVSADVGCEKPFSKKQRKGKVNQHKLIHGPVAYNIEIHPPIVIVNLLPEGGRFELMHAIRKTVVWYADLKPGQQIPVHSLGLDSPLLLLVNLGFCRTPIGEGALVHHGGESVVNSRDHNAGFKSLGKAVTKGTKKIGKRLSTLTETPDKRAQERVAKMFSPKAPNDGRRKKGNLKHKRMMMEHGALDLDFGESGASGGKVHAVEATTYSVEDVANETTVVDSVGQRLTLRIENIRGGGGQRRISLFCPFWIVNTTEHALRYKEDKEKRYVSGTVISPDKDGSAPIDGSNGQYRLRHKDQLKRFSGLSAESHLLEDTKKEQNKTGLCNTVFAGTPGAIATSPGRCSLSPRDISNMIDQDMPLQKLAEIAFMFNFHDDSLGSEKLIVQLYDGLRALDERYPDYTSGWSAGFALETVGFSQVIRLPCKDGRMLELSATVNVAPGFLSGYTKIVRFCPRYAIYNCLDRPIRLWQDSSIGRSLNEDRSDANRQLEDQSDSRKWRYEFEDKHRGEKITQYESLFGRFATLDDKSAAQHDGVNLPLPDGTAAHRSAMYISSVGPSQLLPFFLPDTRSDNQLRVDVGGPWNLTSSFASNVPGEHVLPISRATDIRILNHVSIRDAPKYKIILPPPQDMRINGWDGELGAYFETEWINKEERKIVVKGTKRGKFAFNHTDMRVGDELLRINGVSVLKMTFQEAMKTIKDKLTEIRDYEDKIRRRNNGGIVGNTKGVLRRLSLGGKQSIKGARSLGGGNKSRVMRRFSLGAKRRDPTIDDEDIVEPSPLTMTFRTQEERLRKLRIKAIKARNSAFAYADNTLGNLDPESLGLEPIESLTVETKALHNTMFIILRNADDENPPFKVQNRSLKYSLFYRQRNCEEHEWNILTPGESRSYTWEEPMKSKKLSVRVAINAHDIPVDHEKERISDSNSDDGSKFGFEIELDESVAAVRTDRLKQVLAYQYVNNEERGGFGLPTTVRLEEIGFQTLLPVPSIVEGTNHDVKFLNCEVDTDGGTRLLVISDLIGEDERETMQQNLKNLKKQILYEQNRSIALQAMKYALSQPVHSPRDEDIDYVVKDEPAEENRARSIEKDLLELVEEFPEGNSITKKCQVVVQVLEAVGLRSSDFTGTSNPYCEVFYKGRLRSRKHFLQKRLNKRKTYFIEKTLNPKWNNQCFVFDVSEEAINLTRGHSIQIVIRDFRAVGQHPILGQASMHFASIRNQRELVGWWPLVGRYAGNTDMLMDGESDRGRGSVKLRVQWIYSLHAMVEYYSLMSHRRLLALTATEKGMQEQLKSAEESFQRKRETIDRLPGGRISKLVKLQRNPFGQKDATIKRKKEERNKKSGATSNSNFLYLRETMKSSRIQSLNALTIQTVESRRRRRKESEEKEIGNDSTGASRVRRNSSYSERSEEVGMVVGHSPSSSPAIRNRTQSLGDYFAKQRSTRRPRRGSSEWAGSHRISHRKLSLELDDPSIVESIILDSNLSQMGKPQRGDSDVSTDSTDAQEQARRKNDIARLHTLGFVFHHAGECFHYDHLPNHFRRLLFANTGGPNSELLHRRRFYVGKSSFIRFFRSWQAASALLWDPDVELTKTKTGVCINLKQRAPVQSGNAIFPGEKNLIISEKLSVPNDAPRAIIERSKCRIHAMQTSRAHFERTCRRILGCVLNPGGWLTIRPIAATNLPDSYTGMYVKASHGSEVQTSETVDAKVSPKWSTSRSANSSKLKGRRRTSFVQPPSTAGASEFEFSENDFHLHIEPQQTGGSIRISVIAERYKTKVELGVVYLPLGAAIAACIDAEQSVELSNRSKVPVYTRWFPLMDPDSTTPVAGDMGLSTRPDEQEQLSDNLFKQYFTPSIKLSLMWWPREQNQMETEEKDKNGRHKRLSQTTTIPTIKSYINSDLGSVSLALIDSVRAMELLNLSLRDIDAKYVVTKSKTRMGLVIGWIQLDQQDDNSREPVVFAPTPSEYLQPTLQFLALKDNLRTKSNIVSYEYVGVAFQEMDLTVEEPRVYELWDFFMAVMNRKRMKQRAVRGQQHATVVSQNKNIFTAVEPDRSSPSLFDIMQSVENRDGLLQKKKTYIEQLILGLVKINLSYVKGKKQIYELSETGSNTMHDFAMVKGGNMQSDNQSKVNGGSEVFMKWSQLTSDEDNASGSAGAHNLPGVIAAVFPSVSDAPIRLQGKLVEHVFESPVEIISSLKNYYTNETLKQVYKIIGSLDFVGNPTILLSSFMSGVKDLVSVPTAAFMKAPANVKEVGIGVGKGTVSFVSHSASGFFGFTARLFSQAGQATAFFSLDSDYRQWHRERVVNEATNLERVWKRRGMQNLEEIVLRPIADVFLGFTLGLSGVLLSPYRGAQEKGAKGFIIGTGLGIAGLVTKPVVGVFDALTHGSQSIHDIAKTINFLERRHQPVLKLRLPYVFGPMKILSPFDATSARSLYLLSLFPRTAKSSNQADEDRELHVHSEVLRMEPGVETYAIVTNIRIVLLKVKRDTANSLMPYFCWEVELSTSATISSRISDHGHNGVALTITKSDGISESKKGKKETSKSGMKSLRRSSVSSSFGVPLDEVLEEPESLGAVGDLGEDFLSPQFCSRPTVGNPISELVSSGVKQQGNKTFEWFAVLAEYQQRKQLNRINNAISCIVGEYEAIIPNATPDKEAICDFGTTSFGIYKFEKGLPDGRAAQVSNLTIVEALEEFYWIDHDLVQRISSMSSSSKKRRALEKILRSWDFSHDMSSSRSMGGPDWLVLARAKAMAVFHHDEPDVGDESSLPTTTEHRLFEERGLNIRSLRSRSRTGLSSDVAESSDYSFADETLGHPNLLPGNDEEIVVGLIQNDETPKSTRNLQSEKYGFGESIIDNPSSEMTRRESTNDIVANGRGEASIIGASNNHDPNFGTQQNDLLKGVKNVASFESVDMNHPLPPVTSLYLPDRESLNQDSASPMRTLSRNTKTGNTESGSASIDSARIDRLEGIMEQLVILNATQIAHVTHPQSNNRDDTAKMSLPSQSHHSASSEVHELADNLKQELHEIRAKMAERAREDAALRQEIGLLRGQLAGRRSPSRYNGERLDASDKSDLLLRPPPINTKFRMKRRPSIKSFFEGRTKKKQLQQKQQHDGQSRDIVDINNISSGLSTDHTPDPPLGLNDELSESQASFF